MEDHIYINTVERTDISFFKIVNNKKDTENDFLFALVT